MSLGFSRSGFLDTNKPYFLDWWEACESLDPVVDDYILFSLITPSRSIESATLRWSDVDLTKDRMVYWNTKNGQDYIFPIAPLTRTILLRRRKQKINDFVFGYTDSEKGHVVCPPQYHIKLVRATCGATLGDARPGSHYRGNMPPRVRCPSPRRPLPVPFRLACSNTSR